MNIVITGGLGFIGINLTKRLLEDGHKIIVLDEGQLVEQGSHDQLMAIEGIYKDLYDKQMTSEETEVFE